MHISNQSIEGRRTEESFQKLNLNKFPQCESLRYLFLLVVGTYVLLCTCRHFLIAVHNTKKSLQSHTAHLNLSSEQRKVNLVNAADLLLLERLLALAE